jgi:PAS domain S-box-containing protein
MDAQGKIINFLAVKEDITTRKRSEEELKKSKNNLEIQVRIRTAELSKSEERFRSTLDNLMEGCMFIGYDWIFLYVNDSATKQIHASRETIIGHTMMEIFPGVEILPILEGLQVSMDKRIHNQFVIDFKYSDGSVNWFDLHVEPVTEGIFVISSDVTKRILAEKALRTAGLYHRNLIEASLDSLVTIGPDGKITDVNATTENITGYNREKLIGTTFSDYFTDPENARSGYKKIFMEGSVRDYPLEIKHINGHITPVLYNASLFKDENGQVVGAFASARDITERIRGEEAIKRMNTELEMRVVQRTIQLQNANQELKAFSYSVSHDLRGPLANINGWSQILFKECKDQLGENGNIYLNRVISESIRMGILIEDILKLSKVTLTELKMETVDLSVIAQNIVRRLKEKPTDHRIDFIIPPGIIAFCDPHLLDIALTNLLENAYKFTGKLSQADIEFGKSIMEGKPTYWVRDNGAGFDMANSKNLFGAFQRLHKQADFPGTGIGLATVQRIIHRHGGDIRAESKINQGTTFYFTLPEDRI